MINFTNSLILVAVAAVVTFLLRAIPFWIFGGKKNMPEGIRKVADLLPAAIMAVLVVYCIKDSLYGIRTISEESVVTLISTIVALASVIGVHLWKRKTLISIATGTLIYMVLIRILPMVL